MDVGMAKLVSPPHCLDWNVSTIESHYHDIEYRHSWCQEDEPIMTRVNLWFFVYCHHPCHRRSFIVHDDLLIFHLAPLSLQIITCSDNNTPSSLSSALCLVVISKCWHANMLNQNVDIVNFKPAKHQHASIVTVMRNHCCGQVQLYKAASMAVDS